MSLVIAQDGREVHYPANPDKFAFDAEVVKVFPAMARKSIPNYEEGHRLHCAIIAHSLYRGAAVLDVGASHGEFYRALHREYRLRGELPPPMRMVATDNSEEMCATIRSSFAEVEVLCQSLMSDEFWNCEEQFDAINCMYVLQFLPSYAQYAVIAKLCSMLKRGGILSLGQKEAHDGLIGDMLHEQYINFRLNSGYTQAEIDAKTRALKGAMWPMRREQIEAALSDLGMHEITPTTRWGVFSTYLARK